MSDVLASLWHWTPMLARGFAMNVVISLAAMATGTLAGLFIGLGRIAAVPMVRRVATGLTHLVRNTPAVVLLFYLTLILPSEISLGGLTIPLPAWVKATIGLSLPVTGFMSDATYGAARAIPVSQWDAAAVLPLGRWQSLTQVILPQMLPVLAPPWVGYFAITVMASSTAALVGVEEILTQATVAIEAEPGPSFVIPIYFYVLCWFFAFCYPVSRLTNHLGSPRWL